MNVVTDASPLHYLILIEEVSLLPRLFQRVIVPPAVVEELSRPQAPRSVREWMATPRTWLPVETPKKVLPNVARLGPGEAEAISLAYEIDASLVLLDDRQGVKIARSAGLTVTGTLGVLQTAANLNAVSLPSALAALKQTTFRYSPALFDELLRTAEKSSDVD